MVRSAREVKREIQARKERQVPAVYQVQLAAKARKVKKEIQVRRVLLALVDLMVLLDRLVLAD